jgi:hypothetical protein
VRLIRFLQGGIVDSALGFAMETQTRPVYDGFFFSRGATPRWWRTSWRTSGSATSSS